MQRPAKSNCSDKVWHSVHRKMLPCNLRWVQASTAECFNIPITSRFIKALLDMMSTRCARAHDRRSVSLSKLGRAMEPEKWVNIPPVEFGRLLQRAKNWQHAVTAHPCLWRNRKKVISWHIRIFLHKRETQWRTWRSSTTSICSLAIAISAAVPTLKAQKHLKTNQNYKFNDAPTNQVTCESIET